MNNMRLGKVISVNEGNRTARVRFDNLDSMQSRSLHILDRPRIVIVEGIEYPVKLWTPKINDIVLCIYPEGIDGTGYILGLK